MRLTSIGRQLLMTIALPVILLALWWVVSADNTSPFWPSLQKILQAFPDTWTSDRVMEDIVPSLARLALGYALALLVGVGLGTVIGLSRPVRAFLEPALEFLRAIPPPVIIPVIALFVGYSGWTSKIIAIALGCLWPILLNTVEGVRGLDEVLVDTARSYRFRRPTYLYQVVLRGSSPQVATGARQALSIGVIMMVISELFAPDNGLGAAIVQAQRAFAIPEMWTGIILLGVIGFLLSLIFRLAEWRALAWYRGLRRSERGT